MYQIAALNKPSIKALIEIQNAGGNHKPAFAIALGYVIGSQLALPNTEVTDVISYYRMNHALAVQSILSKINELAPFNIAETDANVRGFYQHRVAQMNPVKIPLALNPECSLTDFFSINAYFSRSTIDTISNNGAEVTRLISLLNPIYDDIKAVCCSTVDAPAPVV